MHISTIIVTYNAIQRNWLFQCLNSLQKSSVKTSIIVVDNASTDETCKTIKENYPEVILIENKENRGFGQANNQGLEVALAQGSEFFFLLNQDAYVEPNTIEKLVNILEKNPDYGIVSPLHLNGKGNALDYNFSLYINPTQCKSLYSDFVLQKVQDQIYESGFICAAAWLLSKKCLETVGGFSPVFFHYAEDDNYIHRLKYKNLKIGVYPMVNIFHDREERPKNSFFDSEKIKIRHYLLEHSNPNLDLDISKEISSLKKKILKYRILLDRNMIKYLKHEIKKRKDIKNLIETNLKLSKSKKKYIFLNHE